MNRRFVILFLTCLAVLICSEYFLVTEMYNGQRAPVLLSSACGLLGSILVSWWAYRRFHKANTSPA
ncbi:MAG: hypothetical protein EOO15_02270 [Chitinophagaceae bacterium]|nr:MAG: hypothetical protein EOO15_02270 [Chitinophagaceae bacterium]